MAKYEYLSNQRIRLGGVVLTSSSLTKLDAKTLQLAIKSKIIKEIKDESRSKKGSDSGEISEA